MMMLRLSRPGLILGALLWASLAFGQANNSSTWETPGHQVVPGVVPMALNGGGQAVGPLAGAAGYPPGALPIAQGTNAADTTSLAGGFAGVGSQFAYLCGFEVGGLGATAGATVVVTVGPLTITGNTLSYEYTFVTGATVPNTPLVRTFTPCLPSQLAGGTITITVPGLAGNTSTIISSWGYRQ